MARQRTNLDALWREIELAGSIDAYVDAQLQEHGFMVQRSATDNMSASELKTYKEQLKKEAEERRRLRRESWQAYRSKHIVHLGEGIFWNDSYDWDKWDLDNAEERAAQNELPPIDTPQKLAELLELTIPQLRWLSYHREAAKRVHYQRFTIPKHDGTERAIWAPLPKLKETQRWILRNIVERLLVHGSVHGFLAGRSIFSNAAVHADAKLVLKMDMKDFFPTLTFPRVKGMFRKAGYREQIATLLALLCTEPPREEVTHGGEKYYVALGPRCLPQGAPTSPAITNVICMKLDQRLSGYAKKIGWRYTRYADDMTFSLPASHKGPPQTGKLTGMVKRLVAEEGFVVHPKKTRVARKGARQSVTGLVVNGSETPRVHRQTRRRLRAAIHNLGQGKPLHEGETLDTLRGYAAFIAMTNPTEGGALLAKINALDSDDLSDL
ncbi:MAG: reverse transcriptase family protein [Pirellulaceae bacterium]